MQPSTDLRHHKKAEWELLSPELFSDIIQVLQCLNILGNNLVMCDSSTSTICRCTFHSSSCSRQERPDDVDTKEHTRLIHSDDSFGMVLSSEAFAIGNPTMLIFSNSRLQIINRLLALQQEVTHDQVDTLATLIANLLRQCVRLTFARTVDVSSDHCVRPPEHRLPNSD